MNDKEFLNYFVERLKENGFSFEKSFTMYNPIEIFLDQVSKKEDAHSDIIAGLMNPEGSHRQGNAFLKTFLEKCDLRIPIEQINWKTISVTRERVAYNEEGSRRRIDILVEGTYHNNESFALIIENKLNGAGYQNNQLEDYRNSLIKDIGNEKNVFVVCLLTGTYQENAASDKSFLPFEIGKMIEEAFSKSDDIMSTLKSYTNYLKNLSSNTMKFENAIRLSSVGLSREDLGKLRAISEAYLALPKAYSNIFMEEHIKNEFTKNKFPTKDYKYEISRSFPDYCLIWNEDSYRGKETWQFLAVRFYEDHVKFYLVSNDSSQKESERKAANINFSNPESGKGWLWYTYNGSDLPREIQFKEKENKALEPDWKEILRVTKEYLDRLDDTETILKGI